MRRKLRPEDVRTMRDQLDSDLRAGRLNLRDAAKRMRAILCKSQADFAQLVGVSARTYIDFERGAGNPTLDTLDRIAALFGLAVKFGPLDTLADRGETIRAARRALKSHGGAT